PMLHDITRKNDWRDRIVKYYEKKLISKADRVIYASPLTLKVQRDTFPDLAHKMDYANQVYASVQSNGRDSVNRGNTSQISVAYSGAYRSTVRNIFPLYNAARMKGFRLSICGPSDLQLQSTDNITVRGKLPYKEATRVESESDVIACLCNRRGTQIPGKIYYCAAYKKPIVVILDGEYKEELREFLGSFDRFLLCENDENSIIEAIEQARDQLRVGEYELPDQLKPECMARRIIGEFAFVGSEI
ncbi:MAG: glycosyltransferase family 4 protein, partial [Firmicutes bacterium]|nr:glycosyltransferase family 4 protein [Bacillota bacterium]